MDHSNSSTMDPSHMNHSHTTTMDHSNMDHGSSSMDHSAMGHNMVIHFGYEVTVVFNGWRTTNEGQLVATCIGLFFIAFIMEFIKFVRIHFLKKKFFNKLKTYTRTSKSAAKYDLSNEIATDTSSEENGQQKVKTPYYKKIFNGAHFLQTMFYFVQVLIAYFLMLAFMTYNFWVCLSILLGLSTGFFLFGYSRQVYGVNEDDCH